MPERFSRVAGHNFTKLEVNVVKPFLSVQCYAIHGQINLPCVCMCVCASVTLSVNSPTGQTPQRIFTLDSLKDTDLRKDVSFGVSMMNTYIYGSKVPETSISGAE